MHEVSRGGRNTELQSGSQGRQCARRQHNERLNLGYDSMMLTMEEFQSAIFIRLQMPVRMPIGLLG